MPYYFSQRAANELMNLREHQSKKANEKSSSSTSTTEVEGNAGFEKNLSLKSKVNISDTSENSSQNEFSYTSTTEDQIELFLKEEPKINVASTPEHLREETKFINFNIDLKCGIMPFLNLAHPSSFGESQENKLRAFWATGKKKFNLTEKRKKFLFFSSEFTKEKSLNIYLVGSLDNISETNSLNVGQKFSHNYPSDPSILTKTLLTELNYDQSIPNLDIQKLHNETVYGFQTEYSETPMLNKVIEFTEKASTIRSNAQEAMPDARHTWISQEKRQAKLIAYIHEIDFPNDKEINIFARPILIR